MISWHSVDFYTSLCTHEMNEVPTNRTTSRFELIIKRYTWDDVSVKGELNHSSSCLSPAYASMESPTLIIHFCQPVWRQSHIWTWYFFATQLPTWHDKVTATRTSEWNPSRCYQNLFKMTCIILSHPEFLCPVICTMNSSQWLHLYP